MIGRWRCLSHRVPSAFSLQLSPACTFLFLRSACVSSKAMYRIQLSSSRRHRLDDVVTSESLPLTTILSQAGTQPQNASREPTL